jgi:hypothetical protein
LHWLLFHIWGPKKKSAPALTLIFYHDRGEKHMNDATKAAQAPPVQDAIDELAITLQKPVQAHGEEVRILKFREPTGADIERCGLPVRFIYMMETGSIEVQTDGKAMTQMMSLLAAVPPSTIKMLTAQDWVTSSWVLQRFFQPR